MLPFKLCSSYKGYIWGGERLATQWGKKTSMRPVAESWEVSCHPDGESKACSGKYAGNSLQKILEIEGREKILGSYAAQFTFFPLLCKLIDAAKPLSIQVHPSDEYAMEKEGSFGKTEMWIILDADPDSYIYYGVNAEITQEQFRALIENNRLETALQKVLVHKGDIVFIPAGTLHAIGKGILLYEVQQNSNLTYRVYDYGRVGADGKPRTLHVEKAMEVANLKPSDISLKPAGKQYAVGEAGSITYLGGCSYFSAYQLEISGRWESPSRRKSFLALTCIEGTGHLECDFETLEFTRGETIFIPVNSNKFVIEGKCSSIVTGCGTGDIL